MQMARSRSNTCCVPIVEVLDHTFYKFASFQVHGAGVGGDICPAQLNGAFLLKTESCTGGLKCTI